MPTPTVAVDPTSLPAFGALRNGLPTTPFGAIRISMIVAAESHGDAVVITERALRAARTILTLTGAHPQLTNTATSTGTPIHFEPALGGSFFWARPFNHPSGYRQLHLGSHITGQDGGDLRIYIATTVTAPTMPDHLTRLAGAHMALDNVMILRSVHGPNIAVGAAVLELVFPAPTAPPPTHASGLAIAAGYPDNRCEPPRTKSAQRPATLKRPSNAAPAPPPTERRHRERTVGRTSADILPSATDLPVWAPSATDLPERAPAYSHPLRGSLDNVSIGSFVAVLKIKSYPERHLTDDADGDIPPLVGILHPLHTLDDYDDVPSLYSLSTSSDDDSDSQPDGPDNGQQWEDNSDGGMPPLHPPTVRRGTGSGITAAADQDAVDTQNRDDIGHDLVALRTRLNELTHCDQADAGTRADQATSRYIDALLGPRRPRATPHPNAAPPLCHAWPGAHAPSYASAVQNPTAWICPIDLPGVTVTHLDDTQMLRRAAPAYGEPAQGRTLYARLHPWMHDNPGTVDVSCAYGKARGAIG